MEMLHPGKSAQVSCRYDHTDCTDKLSLQSYGEAMEGCSKLLSSLLRCAFVQTGGT
jgi:hypothetical protein